MQLNRIVSSIFLICFSLNLEAQHPGGAEAPGVTPDTALGYLKNGNIRFLSPKMLRKDGQAPKDIERLSSGQHPHTIVLSCSDSRVPPEVIFDQKLGEIFVVRVAGEALDSSVIASVEYAAEHLGSSLILVMGHTECGAVKAALGAKAGVSSGSPDLDKLVADIRPRILVSREVASTPSPHFALESTKNAKGVARQLSERSKLLRERIESGKLKVASSLYHLDSGKVEFMEED